MKKLFYSSIALICFSVAITLFQISCQKQAVSATNNTTTVQNKFLYSKVVGTTWQYWISNIDGTNQIQIPISLPTGFFPGGTPKLSQDAQTVIFSAYGDNGSTRYIYSMSLNGSNLKELFNEASTPGSQQLDINQTF